MKLDPIEAFLRDKKERIKSNPKNISLIKASADFTRYSIVPKYSYNFTWLGRSIIQYPQDMIAMQEIIWQVKPGLIIETGIARGGSPIFYASMLNF